MASVREHPATAVAGVLAALAVVYSALPSRNLPLGIVVAAVLVGIGAVGDWMPLSMPAPREFRATILVLPTVVLSGIYTVSTPTNPLLWLLGAVVMIGIGLVVDSLLAR